MENSWTESGAVQRPTISASPATKNSRKHEWLRECERPLADCQHCPRSSVLHRARSGIGTSEISFRSFAFGCTCFGINYSTRSCDNTIHTLYKSHMAHGKEWEAGASHCMHLEERTLLRAHLALFHDEMKHRIRTKHGHKYWKAIVHIDLCR